MLDNPRPPHAPTRFSGLAYVTNGLDRMSGRRGEDDFLAGETADPRARTIVILDDAPVLRREAAGVDALFALDAEPVEGERRERIYLGRAAGGPRFATLFSSAGNPPATRGEEVVLGDLRGIAAAGELAEDLVGQVSTAKAVLGWHTRHRFCSACGTPTLAAFAGWRRDCPACKTQHFPRVDPVVIMLVTDGERCLLGRQPRFVPGMYSCLAGFMEPGETMEDAVRREVMEEAGVVVGPVAYRATQPWAFPSSLMFGTAGLALSNEITIDRDELEDARWFTREEMAAMLEKRHPAGLLAPQPLAIAHHLIREFVEKGPPQDLA